MEDLGYSQNQIDQMDIAYHMEKLGHRKQMSKDGKNKNQSNEPDYITFDQFADSVKF